MLHQGLVTHEGHGLWYWPLPKSDLNIDKSNTLVHDNTGEGVKKAFDTTLKATRTYSKKVTKGEDVLTGFYKEEAEL